MTWMFYGKEILHICGYWRTILFWQLQITLILVYHETGCIRNLISLALHACEEHLNRRLYTSCASIWRQCASGLWIGKKHGYWTQTWEVINYMSSMYDGIEILHVRGYMLELYPMWVRKVAWSSTTSVYKHMTFSITNVTISSISTRVSGPLAAMTHEAGCGPS
jgi:hypothetical protein